MKTLVTFIFIVLFALAAQAQTGHTFQEYYIPAGSNTLGYPIVTAVVPVGSYIVTVGGGNRYDSEGNLHREALLTYIVPLSPDPQTMETHLYIAGVCQGIRAPSGYRKTLTYRNIYGIDNPDTGGFDNTTEFCVVEIVPR